MAGWRQAIELALSEEDVTRLGVVARSRTEPASRVERARILLAYWEDRSFFAVAQAIGVHHQTVQRCIERAVAYGPMAALDDRPRPGKKPTIVEGGVPYVSEQFWGLAAPGKTPPDIVNRLAETLRKAVQTPQLKEQFAREGGEPVLMTQDEFAKYVLADVERWRQIVKDIKLQLE